MKYYHITDSDLILIVNHTEYKCLFIIFNVLMCQTLFLNKLFSSLLNQNEWGFVSAEQPVIIIYR